MRQRDILVSVRVPVQCLLHAPDTHTSTLSTHRLSIVHAFPRYLHKRSEVLLSNTQGSYDQNKDHQSPNNCTHLIPPVFLLIYA